MSKNFEQFTKKMQEIEGVIPEKFLKVAKKAGIKFVNKAKDLTDENGLVDTGNYKRNWAADIGVIGNGKAFVVKCQNPVEYANHLEWGHKIRGKETKTKGYFVGKQAKETAEEYAIKELKYELGDLFEE